MGWPISRRTGTLRISESVDRALRLRLNAPYLLACLLDILPKFLNFGYVNANSLAIKLMLSWDVLIPRHSCCRLSEFALTNNSDLMLGTLLPHQDWAKLRRLMECQTCIHYTVFSDHFVLMQLVFGWGLSHG